MAKTRAKGGSVFSDRSAHPEVVDTRRCPSIAVALATAGLCNRTPMNDEQSARQFYQPDDVDPAYPLNLRRLRRAIFEIVGQHFGWF